MLLPILKTAPKKQLQWLMSIMSITAPQFRQMQLMTKTEEKTNKNCDCSIIKKWHNLTNAFGANLVSQSMKRHIYFHEKASSNFYSILMREWCDWKTFFIISRTRHDRRREEKAFVFSGPPEKIKSRRVLFECLKKRDEKRNNICLVA